LSDRNKRFISLKTTLKVKGLSRSSAHASLPGAGMLAAEEGQPGKLQSGCKILLFGGDG
jgi:hypothetical protein